MQEKDMPDFLNDEKQPSDEDVKFEQAKERLNFDISALSPQDNQDAVPYDFRSEHKIVTDEEENVVEKSSASIRFHAIGIGILIGVLLAVLISVFLFDNNDNDEKNAKPVVITQSQRPVKERPAVPGGMEIPDRDKTVYQKMRSDEIKEKVIIVPVSEEKPVQPQVKTKEGAVLGAPRSTMSAQEIEWEVLNLKETPAVQETVHKTESAPLQKTVEEKVIEKTEKEVKKASPKVEVAPVVANETKKAVQTAKTTAKPTAKTTTKESAKDVWHVQLSSLGSKTAAQKELPKILKAHSSLLSGLPNQIKEVNVKGKTFYRLMVGEFKNKTDAQNLCAKLKKQKQDCTITK
ncbi:MAG: SPOR domain-containing protein [Alphaproteobacteria bacterium]